MNEYVNNSHQYSGQSAWNFGETQNNTQSVASGHVENGIMTKELERQNDILQEYIQGLVGSRL